MFLLSMFAGIKGFFTNNGGGINWGKIIVIVLVSIIIVAAIITKMEIDKAHREIISGAKAKVELNNVVSVNKDLVAQVHDVKTTEINAETAITNTVTTDNANKQKIESIVTSRNAAISDVKLPVVVPDKNEDTVSTIRINSMWQTYCALNPTNCK